MQKKYSWKFWSIFWTVSVLFLAGFYLFIRIRETGISSMIRNLPVDNEYKAIGKFADYFLNREGTMTFLVLFENNMEIRPGGGYIGSFGILKVEKGSVKELQIHDLSNFDARIPDTIEPPYPMKETLHIPSWKMRDSNFSPDFPTNAKKAEEFYHLGQGQEQLDGIIAITANVLTSFLKVTGPVEIEGYPGTYQDENAIIALEYQVEKGYVEQGIEMEKRKSVMTELGKEIIKRFSSFSTSQKIKLAEIILQDLERKDIQLYFNDPELQKEAERTDWGGEVDKDWKKDYLMIVDANMGAWKSDYYVKRSYDYSIDLSAEKPSAKLKITYTHTAEKKDWMTKNYLTYLRTYVPEGSWLTSGENFEDAKYGEEFGKKYFGSLVGVPLNSSKTVEINYELPAGLKDSYDLKIQKQAGLKDIPLSIHLTRPDGTKDDYDLTLNSDLILSELE